MDIGKDREIGLFSKKIYTGHLFAEKPYEDFYAEVEKKPPKIDQDVLKKVMEEDNVSVSDANEIALRIGISKEARRLFDAYLDSETMKEYVFMREPSNEEARQAQISDISKEILDKLPVEAQVTRAENNLAKERAKEAEILELVLKCIVGSSFMIDGKQAPIDKVREIYSGSARATSYLTSEWMSSANFRKRSDRV